MRLSTNTYDIREVINEACARIAPVWPLKRFVAVNPFLGLSGTQFDEALDSLERNSGASCSLPPSYYRSLYAEGTITRADLFEILQALHPTFTKNALDSNINELLDSLECDYWPDQKDTITPLLSLYWDEQQGTRWASFFTEEISKWCAAYFDEGQSIWRMPWKGKPLFPAWKAAAKLDHNPAAAGLLGWRTLVRNLTDDPILEIERATALLGIPVESAGDFFHSILLSISGWAGHLQFKTYEQALRGGAFYQLIDLLAIRIAYEVALYQSHPDEECIDAWRRKNISTAWIRKQSISISRLWQRAHELAMQRQLLSQIEGRSSLSTGDEKLPQVPSFQAVFCIDVRSEIYRRALETCAPDGETIGFAGFFGFPIEAVPIGETTGTPQCPVLLTPAVRVPESASPLELRKAGNRKRWFASW